MASHSLQLPHVVNIYVRRAGPGCSGNIVENEGGGDVHLHQEGVGAGNGGYGCVVDPPTQAKGEKPSR